MEKQFTYPSANGRESNKGFSKYREDLFILVDETDGRIVDNYSNLAIARSKKSTIKIKEMALKSGIIY